jgi:hypothetical protein
MCNAARTKSAHFFVRPENKMWSLATDLAQKAKDAVALLESTINDSVGVGEDNDEVAPCRERAPSSGGWEKCDLSSHGSGPRDAPTAQQQEMSFVDLKAVMDEIPENDDGKLESNSALLDALARIESLEGQVSSLKNELVLAQAAKISLERQVKELEEQNRNLNLACASDN